MTTSSPEITSNSGTARRNALVLAVAQAFGGAMPVVVVAVGGLAGTALLGVDKSLATLPIAASNVGVALGALPAAFILARIGRRNGFIVGTIIGALGGLGAALAILGASFVGLVAFAALLGLSFAFYQQFRFAAADGATDPALKAKAISWVMLGGIAAAVIGPQAVILSRWAAPSAPLAAAFASTVLLMAVSAAALWFFRNTGPARQAKAVDGTARSLSEIARQPRFIVAVLCAIASFGLMSLVMTAAPIAMTHVGHHESEAALGIQWHVMAMFVPSFFTGSLIARFGKERVVAFGLALLAVCAIVALSGTGLLHFWGALILLGVGWNFGFIGATAMLTETYTPAEAGRAQGLNDVLLFGSVAIASLASGGLLNSVGWSAINAIVFPTVTIALIGLVWIGVLRSRKATGAAE